MRRQAFGLAVTIAVCGVWADAAAAQSAFDVLFGDRQPAAQAAPSPNAHFYGRNRIPEAAQRTYAPPKHISRTKRSQPVARTVDPVVPSRTETGTARRTHRDTGAAANANPLQRQYPLLRVPAERQQDLLLNRSQRTHAVAPGTPQPAAKAQTARKASARTSGTGAGAAKQADLPSGAEAAMLRLKRQIDTGKWDRPDGERAPWLAGQAAIEYFGAEIRARQGRMPDGGNGSVPAGSRMTR